MNLQQLHELRRAERAVGEKLARLPQRADLSERPARKRQLTRR
jgi:hypothetical protein